MTATWLAPVLNEVGLDVTSVPNWAGRGRPGLNPIAIVIHHTASQAGRDAPALPTVINGRQGIPGPLYNVLVTRSGRVWVIAAGVASHAGSGRWRGATGNASALGVAAENNGVGEPWPTAQVDAWVTVCAALCRQASIPTAMVCGHREWTPRKIDPTGIDMHRFRLGVSERLLTLEQAAPMTPVASAQAMLNSWLEPARHIPADGAWGPRTTAALAHVLDVVASGTIRDRDTRLATAATEIQALKDQLAAAQAVPPGAATARDAALAAIGAETVRWIQSVTDGLTTIDQL